MDRKQLLIKLKCMHMEYHPFKQPTELILLLSRVTTHWPIVWATPLLLHKYTSMDRNLLRHASAEESQYDTEEKQKIVFALSDHKL